MRDRLLNGLVAGLVGGTAAKAWSLFSYYVLHFSKLLMLDWMDLILIGHAHRNLAEWLTGLLMVYIWFTLLGVGWAYLFANVHSHRHLVKGAAFGAGIFFAVYAGSKLLKTTVAPMTWQTVVSDFVVAIIFGTVTAAAMKRLDNPTVVE